MMPGGHVAQLGSSMSVFIGVLSAVVAVWAWYDFMRARETAVAYARSYCRRTDVQLLDDSVALARVRPGIRARRLGFARLYAFEYTTDGSHRGAGYVALFGHEMVDVDFISEAEGH
jgi:hypothetical protein